MTGTTSTTASGRPTRTDAVDWLALGAALLTVVLWASAFVGIRAVADGLSPGSFALGRLLVAAAALGIIVAVRRPDLPTRRARLAPAERGAAGAGLRRRRAVHRRRDRRAKQRSVPAQAASVSVIQVARPATVAVRTVPHAMSTTVTSVGQPRSVAWLVRSYVA